MTIHIYSLNIGVFRSVKKDLPKKIRAIAKIIAVTMVRIVERENKTIAFSSFFGSMIERQYLPLEIIATIAMVAAKTPKIPKFPGEYILENNGINKIGIA